MTAKTPKLDLSPTLQTIPLSEALECFTELDDQFGVVPTAAKQRVAEDIAKILTTADQLGITSLAQLIAHQRELLLALTGVKHLTWAHPTQTAEPLHVYRNLVVAISAAAAALNAPIDESARAADAVFALAPQLAARTTWVLRPFADDEILLLRVYAALTSRHSPCAESANAYALVDAGMTPTNATAIDASSLDDPEHPTYVIAPGNRNGVQSRLLLLDQFNQRVIGRRLQPARDAGQPHQGPLAYTPRTNIPGSNAAGVSAHRILARVIRAVGLTNVDVKASSIHLWRINTIYLHKGIEAAAQAHGRNSHERTLAALCAYEFDPEPADDDEVTSFMSC